MSTKYESVKDLSKLDGEKAIVTSAGSGISRSIALGLAEYRVDVALFGHTSEKLVKVQREIEEKFPVKTLVVNTDIMDSKQIGNRYVK